MASLDPRDVVGADSAAQAPEAAQDALRALSAGRPKWSAAAADDGTKTLGIMQLMNDTDDRHGAYPLMPHVSDGLVVKSKRAEAVLMGVLRHGMPVGTPHRELVAFTCARTQAHDPHSEPCSPFCQNVELHPDTNARMRAFLRGETPAAAQWATLADRRNALLGGEWLTMRAVPNNTDGARPVPVPGTASATSPHLAQNERVVWPTTLSLKQLLELVVSQPAHVARLVIVTGELAHHRVDDTGASGQLAQTLSALRQQRHPYGGTLSVQILDDSLLASDRTLARLPRTRVLASFEVQLLRELSRISVDRLPTMPSSDLGMQLHGITSGIVSTVRPMAHGSVEEFVRVTSWAAAPERHPADNTSDQAGQLRDQRAIVVADHAPGA